MNPATARGSLHVLTDETSQSRFSHLDLARAAAEHGANVVQFREKRPLSTGALVAIARDLADALRQRRVGLVVNDRVDVALAMGANGVHLGREDLEPGLARRLLGREATIGATAHSVEEARAVDRADIDYLGVGPVFGTSSKVHSLTPLGLEGLRSIVQAVSRPVIAIGNITPELVRLVLESGARGVAVLATVAQHADPASQVRRLREALDQAASSMECE